MARQALAATFGQSLGEGQFIVRAGAGGDATLDQAALDAAIAAAQLIGTGDASAEIDAIDTEAQALAPTNTGDVSITYDDSVVTSLNHLRRAFDALLRAAAASGKLTP